MLGAESVAHGRCERGIKRGVQSTCNIVRSQRRAVREFQTGAQTESNRAALIAELPRLGQFRFNLIAGAIDTNQNSSCKVADDLRRLLRDLKGIECLRV